MLTKNSASDNTYNVNLTARHTRQDLSPLTAKQLAHRLGRNYHSVLASLNRGTFPIQPLTVKPYRFAIGDVVNFEHYGTVTNPAATVTTGHFRRARRRQLTLPQRGQ